MLVTPAPGQVTFSVTGGDNTTVFAADSNAGGGVYRLSDASDSVVAGHPADSGDSVTTITLGGSYTAFAVDYGMENNRFNISTFALFNDNTQVGTTFNAPTLSGDQFFGATSDTVFNSVRVTAAAGERGFVVFDNARVGSASATVVPEAGTLALLLPALGVLGIGVVVRRRRAA